MTLDEINALHCRLMADLIAGVDTDTFATDMALVLAGMVAEMTNNIAKPGKEKMVLKTFTRLVEDCMQTMDQRECAL